MHLSMKKQHCFGSRAALDESFRPRLMSQPGVTRRVSQRGSEVAVLHDDCSSGVMFARSRGVSNPVKPLSSYDTLLVLISLVTLEQEKLQIR